jgi:hypothetical protein
MAKTRVPHVPHTPIYDHEATPIYYLSESQLELDEELRKFAEKHLGKMLKAFSTILGLLLLPLSGCSSYYEFSQE